MCTSCCCLPQEVYSATSEWAVLQWNGLPTWPARHSSLGQCKARPFIFHQDWLRQHRDPHCNESHLVEMVIPEYMWWQTLPWVCETYVVCHFLSKSSLVYASVLCLCPKRTGQHLPANVYRIFLDGRHEFTCNSVAPWDNVSWSCKWNRNSPSFSIQTQAIRVFLASWHNRENIVQLIQSLGTVSLCYVRMLGNVVRSHWTSLCNSMYS